MTILPGGLKKGFLKNNISPVKNLSGPQVKNSLPYVQYIQIHITSGYNYISMF